MKLLAIETATAVCGVALTEETRLVADCRLHQPNMHNEKLVRCIQTLLTTAGWQMKQLDAIAVSNGPGSFTGLRIGLSAAKGLAYALDVPLVPVNTLDALAHRLPPSAGDVLVALKARAGEVYAAEYHGPERASDYLLLTFDECRARLQNRWLLPSPLSLAGELGVSSDRLLPEPLALAAPYHVSLVAAQHLRAGSPLPAADVEPFYLKEFVPKRKRYYAESDRVS